MNMNPIVDMEKTAVEIRRLYGRNPDEAESSIEEYLLDSLAAFGDKEKTEIAEKLARFFKGAGGGSSSEEEIEEEVLSKVFALLLGRKVTHEDLSSTELLERLAGSLNTVFDSLNQLVEVINRHLYREYPGQETIRQVIGFHMAGDNQGKPLESYLGQIKRSFLVAQEGFGESVRIMLEKVLGELDPVKISENSGGFKFGPLKKAENFETYEAKYKKIRNWFDSGRFLEDFLREFEKACEKKLT